MPDTIEPAEGAQPAEQPRVRISSPASLLAVIPPLLGFEPSEPSLVVIGTEPPCAEVRITIRFDIPARSAACRRRSSATRSATSPPRASRPRQWSGTGRAAWWTRSPGTFRGASPKPASPWPRCSAPRMGATGLTSAPDPECCPPEGTPFDAEGAPRRREVRGPARPGVPGGAGADHRAGHRGGGRSRCGRADRRAEARAAA